MPAAELLHLSHLGRVKKTADSQIQRRENQSPLGPRMRSFSEPDLAWTFIRSATRNEITPHRSGCERSDAALDVTIAKRRGAHGVCGLRPVQSAPPRRGVTLGPGSDAVALADAADRHEFFPGSGGTPHRSAPVCNSGQRRPPPSNGETRAQRDPWSRPRAYGE